jgi:hypothetical protein
VFGISVHYSLPNASLKLLKDVRIIVVEFSVLSDLLLTIRLQTELYNKLAMYKSLLSYCYNMA